MSTNKKQPPKEPAPQEEVYQPMAVPEPTLLERLEALEIRMRVLEDTTNKHQRYHFGGMTGK